MVDQLFPNLGGSRLASFKPGNPGVYKVNGAAPDAGEQEPDAYNAYDPGDDGGYEEYIDMLIEDAIDYEQTCLAGDRNQATAYYYGFLPGLDKDDENMYSDQVVVQDPNATYADILDGETDTANRSKYVSTDVRDSVLSVLPSLIRIFGASENVVQIIPRTQDEIDIAEQATDYTNYTFWNDNPGFLTLYGAFKDAMTVKVGFVKWWTDDNSERRQKTFVNITLEQAQMLMSEQPGSRVVHHEISPDGSTLALFVIEYEVSKPLVRVLGVPPEEMRLDRNARSFSLSRIVGHERVIPVDDLTAMGYSRDLCNNYLQSTDTHNFTMESQMRNPGRATSTRVPDGVNYGEWYIRADKDGDGIAELRYICTMGENHEIVHDEPANRVKFAAFSCDPISHTIVGDSVADLAIDIQRIKTNITRGVLNSLAESINPKTVVNELMVNLDDAMNDDLGAIIRTRGDPSSAVMYTQTPFAGQAAVPVLQMMDQVLQRRTGLSDAAKGLDPKALQSSTMIGVDAIISGAQERIELIARVLAETGFKDLFTGLFNEICENPNQQRALKIRGKWANYDTSTFDASMGVEVNACLGKGTDMARMLALTNIKQEQTQIMTQFGIANPVCSVTEYLNTLTDMMELANIKNIGRYFKTPPPEVMQQIMSAPKEPDPQTLAAKAMFEKVKSETAAKVGQQQFQQEKLNSDDAYRKAKMEQDRQVKERELNIKAAEAAAKGATLGGAENADLAAVASDHILGQEKNALDHAADLAKTASSHAVGMAKVASDHAVGMEQAKHQPKPNGGSE